MSRTVPREGPLTWVGLPPAALPRSRGLERATSGGSGVGSNPGPTNHPLSPRGCLPETGTKTALAPHAEAAGIEGVERSEPWPSQARSKRTSLFTATAVPSRFHIPAGDQAQPSSMGLLHPGYS